MTRTFRGVPERRRSMHHLTLPVARIGLSTEGWVYARAARGSGSPTTADGASAVARREPYGSPCHHGHVAPSAGAGIQEGRTRRAERNPHQRLRSKAGMRHRKYRSIALTGQPRFPLRREQRSPQRGGLVENWDFLCKAHSYKNVQLACRHCNFKKSHRGKGDQMRLF